MHNSYGDIFRITSFGESHGKVIGIVIDGCPSGLEITAKEIQKDLNRRRPGTSDIVTSRFEDDVIEILSGIKANRTTGAPITIIIKNVNFDSTPYKKIKKTPRPSHADYPALVRYGKWVDLNGGGRFSGRVTASFVIAGAFAKKLLAYQGIKVGGYARSIGKIIDNTSYSISDLNFPANYTGKWMKNSRIKREKPFWTLNQREILSVELLHAWWRVYQLE